MNRAPSPPPVKVAIGSVPKDGGTFTFYRHLRPALAPYGFDVRCVTLGYPQSRLWQDDYADEGCVRLAPGSRSLKHQARAFTRWCVDEGIDIVIAINSEGILSSLPHLPERVRVISRCANGFEHGYRITMSGHERAARIIAVSPRLRDDLIRDHGADPEHIVLVPNGIAPAEFLKVARSERRHGEALELGFLGRLEHKQKGVMHLPEIVRSLKGRGIPFRLRIAGKGSHGPDLRQALAQEVAEGTVEFLGAIGPSQVPIFLAHVDVFLFTSHFEGIANVVIEAMMSGAVPVSWRLHGITDFLIQDGRTGLLCASGDVEAFVAHVAGLHADRERLRAMSQATQAEALFRFTDVQAGRAYADLFGTVMEEPPPPWAPRPWREFRPDPNFPHYWRNRIPDSVRGVGRRLLSGNGRRKVDPQAGNLTLFEHGSDERTKDVGAG